MAQDLTVNIKTTSDVPQAMDRAKSATVSFGKQVDDIQKKFSTAFKDIFLSFLGPMALLGIAMNYIGKLIEDNQRRQAEANKAAIDDTNELMSVEDRYYAKKINNEKKTRESEKEAKLERAIVTEEFLYRDPRGKKILDRLVAGGPGVLAHRNMQAYSFSTDPKVQAEVQAIIAEDAKKNPLPVDKEVKNFQSPAGFSNIVGVGSNPVIQAMSSQLDETKRTNVYLEQLVNIYGGMPSDFTKSTNGIPSRASLLTK